MTLNALQRTAGTLEIMVHLYFDKKLSTTQLISRVHVSQQTTYRALDKLRKHRLIYEEVEDKFPRRKNYSLSDRGVELAETPIYRWNELLLNWEFQDSQIEAMKGKRS